MRTQLTKQLIACLFVALLSTTAFAGPGPKEKSSENASVTTVSKTTKAHDKKNISRCWQRLMTMVREANHAHHVAKR